ncbi:VWA domain-containing protein [Rhodopirellula sp. MGV]|uniref:VWA domain-containing protein n=1 Tax=Rhodopirellula sp. MGV TaxID=2023130 RepID=UPI000B966F39|nr:VWA domain-containing protein [Rhodopirellula sp. MGV]OYP31674.1 hypothetical protein CGZ80_20920 [Rhodopirellula sp. MGV]PNY33963.1 VWA domain-containing protein [Rhodopirellula baltica]
MAKASQRAGWRRSKTGPVRQESDFGSRGRERRKLLFRVSLLTTFAVALAIVLLLVLLRKPDLKVPLVATVVSASGARTIDSPLYAAPNPFAAEDVELFQAWFSGGPNSPDENVKLVSDIRYCSGVLGQGKLVDQIVTPLLNATPGGPNDDMLMVYLSAQGLVDSGQPYFASGESRADKPESWVAGETLVKAIEETLANHANTKSGLKVVLFIDASRVGPQWDWGQLSDTFAEAWQNISATNENQIATIISSSPGERSWWDPRQGQGLFPIAITEALTGAADEDGNGVVTVGEIADHVRTRTASYAARMWNAQQQPMLLNEQARDWEVINQPATRPINPLPPFDVAKLRQDFEKIDQLWQRHNRLAERVHSPLAFDPMGWATLEKHLVRLESLAFSGRSYGNDFSALIVQCAADLAQFEKGSTALPKESALTELAQRNYFYPPSPLTSELEQAIAGWNKKPDPEAFPISLSPTEATRFLTDWLDETHYDAQSIALASTLLEKQRLASTARPAAFLEAHLIRLLSADDLQHVSEANRRDVIQSHIASRDVLFAGDLRVNLWLRDEFDAANEDRLRCLDQILSSSVDAKRSGTDRLREVVLPEMARLKNAATTVSEAYRLRDQMLHRVPRLAETLLADAQAFSQHELLEASQSRVFIKAAIDSLAELNQALRLPENNASARFADRLSELENAHSNAAKTMAALSDRLTSRVVKTVDVKALDALGMRQLFALLQGSGMADAVNRSRVHTKLCEVLSKSQATIEDVQSGGTRTQVSPVSENTDIATQTLRWQSIDEEPLWQYWIRRIDSGLGLAVTVDQERQTDQNENNPSPTTRLNQVFQRRGDSLRDSVANLSSGRLGDSLNAHTAIESPIEAHNRTGDPLTTRRLLSNWDVAIRSRSMLFSHAPPEIRAIGVARFELDKQFLLNDLARRTMDEFWCQAKSGDPGFCPPAAEQLLATRSSNQYYSRLPAKLDGEDLENRLLNLKTAIESTQTLRPMPNEELQQGTLLKFVADRDVDFYLDIPPVIPAGLIALHSPQTNETELARRSDVDGRQLVIPLRFPKQLPEEANQFFADVFFRGLRRGGDVEVKDLVGGRRLVFERPDYGVPVARVTRTLQQPERLILVMDCSGSMRTPTSGGGVSRLEVAKNAVTQFLKGLDPATEVGLIVFGSRYGFSEKNGQIFPEIDNGQQKLAVEELQGGQAKNVGLIRADETVRYNPNFDVQMVRKASPLDRSHREALENEIQNLGAIGVTPTYLAIEKAYAELGNDSGHIIVLTDGKPKVISTSDLTVDDSSRSAMTLADSRRSDIKLTIVKYLDQDTELRRQFPSAKVLDAADGQSLLRYLQEISLKPRIAWQRRGQQASPEVPFGQLVPISTWPPDGSDSQVGQPVIPPARFSIRAIVPSGESPIDELTDVQLQGGERLELELSPQGLQHKAFVYEGSLIRESLQTEMPDAGRYVVHAGPLGKRFNRQLAMQIAIESAQGNRSDGRFTPRPSDVWLELEGIDSRRGQRGRKQTYLFGIPEFKTDQSIPILLCRIDNFPQRFDKIDIKAWFRFADRPIPGTPLPLSSTNPLKLDGISGVSFRTEKTANDQGGMTVVVTESYDDSRELASIRVLPDPLPQKSATVIYDQLRVVVREFVYNDPATPVAISVTDRQAIQNDSTLYAEGDVSIDLDSR